MRFANSFRWGASNPLPCEICVKTLKSINGHELSSSFCNTKKCSRWGGDQIRVTSKYRWTYIGPQDCNKIHFGKRKKQKETRYSILQYPMVFYDFCYMNVHLYQYNLLLVKPSDICLIEYASYKNIFDFYAEHPHDMMLNYFLNFCRAFRVSKDG